jgi:acetamidase/formamidase
MTSLKWLAVLSLCGTAFGQKVLRYDMKMQDLKYVYGPATPVMRLHSGDTVDTNTVDAEGYAQRAAGIKPKNFNALTGPFYIEEAQPGDTLAVKFISLEVDGKEGWGGSSPGWGAINSSKYTPMLGPEVKERVWTYQIDKASNTATFNALDSRFTLKVPMHPFLGCVGVAPADGEVRASITPAEYGGNMDSPEASAGNTLYLPVSLAGAMLYLGDGHAAMGDGEVNGSAIEVSMKVRFQVSVIKRQTITWPRFENDEYIMTAGAYRPLDDATRIAFTELVHWIHTSYGLSDADAYELLSKTAEIHLNEMVDPNYVVIAKVKKKFLPPLKK